MKRTLAFILAVLMTVSCCVFVNAADTVTVTFYDADGTTVLSTATVDPSTGLTEAPSTPASSHDGVYFKVFSGWSLDGTVIDPTTLTYAADTSFTAVYKTFGKIYDDPTAVTIPVVTPTEQEDGTVVGLLADGNVASEFNLLTEEADIAAAANGITFIYKVEGADTEIIADALNISTNAGASANKANYASAQWANDNYKAGTSDGDYPYNFELNNGYFFIYVNDNLNNMNAKTADNTIKKLSIFDDDRSGTYTAVRTPENANENATVSILGYVNDNLQPTVNFYNGDDLIGSYTHAYTNVTKNLGFSTGSGQANSVVEGALLTPAEVYTLLGAAAPTRANTETESFIFNGWVDGEGNPVEAVYTNMDVYASFTTVSKESYTVTFNDKDGNELATGAVETGTKYAGTIPADQATWSDGVYTYAFAGWSVDGKTVVDPTEYIYTENTVFVPAYTQYGVIYENPTATDITYNGSAISLLPGEVALNPGYTGLTLVYKVDGADIEIIADDFRVTSSTGNPAWQWGDGRYSLDGMAPANLELNNGYFYIYMNANVFGSEKSAIKTASIYNSHLAHFYDPNTARDPQNENESATFTMLAVIPNNLQPTVSFVVNGVKTDYVHKYTDITTNIGYPAAGNKTSYQEGKLISIAEAIELSGIEEPTAPEGQVFVGWTKDAAATDAELLGSQYLYDNVTLYPVFKEITDADKVPVYFINKDKETIYTGYSAYGKLLTTDYPASTDAPAADGVHMYKFAGWSVNGKDVVDVATYYYEDIVVFEPVYIVYGEIYENPTAVDITDTSNEINLMTKPALINAGAFGITWIYKVEGADKEIIADSLKVSSTATGNPAGQWNGLNYAADGGYAYQFELNNGYYFLYVNDNLNNMNNLTTDVNYAKFSIYGTHSNYTSARTPVNENEAATVTVLGVISDNLQPVITFHDADGNEIGAYQHKYTDVTRHLGWGAGNSLSVQEGKLINGEQAFVASGLTAPAAPEGYVLYGWTATKGGSDVVEAIYDHIDLYPVFKEITEEDYVDVIFVDENGNTVFNGSSAFGKLMTPDFPTTCDKAHDGVYSYGFEGWSVDGQNVVDPTFYEYDGVVTFKPVYTRYGVVYDDPTSVTISGTDKTDLLTEAVTLGGYGTNGATFVYFVDGVETEIIADDMYIVYNNANANAKPAWQWADLGHNADEMGPANFELNNGYYFLYQNGNICGSGNGNGILSVNVFSIFNSHVDHYYTPSTAREPVNENESATVTMLAVIPDNLQPTVNFYNGDTVIGSYTHKYTDIHKNLGYSANVNSQIEGALLTPAEIYDLSALPTPTKASDDTYYYTFDKWVDAEGNEIDAVYTNMDVYAEFTATEKTGDTYTVTFMDGEKVIDTYEAYAGENPFIADPTKEDDDTGYYTFAGWALTADGEAVDLGDIKVEGDMTIYAIFEHTDVIFTVTYYDNGAQIHTEDVIRSKGAAYTKVPTRPTDAYIEGQDGYYHVFDKWVDAEGNAVDLTNVQSDLVVYSSFNDVLVENWWTITWVDSDGVTVLDTAVVANGEGASTSAMGKLHYTGTETTVYNFTGWDKKTTSVTADTTVTALYTETDIETGANTVIAEGSGTVGTQNDLITNYTYVSSGNKYITLIFDIKGASEENPITIGAIRTNILGIDSNNSGNYAKDTAAIRGVTADGKYYVTMGIHLLTWTTSTFSTINWLTIDHASASRGGKSSGEGTYDVVAIEGALQPTVRFFDEEGNWLYTAKNYYALHNTTYHFDEVPTAAGMYAGPAIDDFVAWVDADGNEVTYVTENMDLYVKGTHKCSYTVATGAGTAVCECGKVSDTAFTIIADPSTEVSEIKAGETVKIPVIVNNGAFAGATLKVVTSDNVTLTAIDVAGTLFEGYTAVLGDTIVLNEALSGANVTEDGIIVYLTLTAAADIAADDVITVQVSAEQVVNITDTELVVADDYVASYTVVAAEADVLWGDVDGSGVVDFMDALYLTRYTEQWDASSYADAEFILECGDVDNSGVVDFMDALYVTRYSEQWDASSYADAINLLKTLG